MKTHKVDTIIFTPDNKLEIVGWCIIQDVTYRAILDDNEYIKIYPTIVERGDIQQKFKLDTSDVGFSIMLDEDWDNYTTVVFEMKVNEKWELIAKKNIEDLRADRIKSKIDEISQKGEQIFIRGWVYSTTDKPVQISTNVGGVTIEKTARADIKMYEDENITNIRIGFEILCDGLIDRIVLYYECDGDKKAEIVDIKAWISREKRGKKNKLFSIINKDTIIKTLSYINEYGIEQAYHKIRNKVITISVYDEWLKKHLPSKTELNVQRATIQPYQPLISIIVPTFNTPKQFLVEMVESVRNQTYSNWELCIADGASVNEETLSILKKYADNEPRIKVQFLEENYGISGNTNKCLEMARGEFVGIFDHDDLLTANALFEVVETINNNPNVDFIYTDEDKVDEKTKIFSDPHFKPDFSPDLIRHQNYICHFCVYRRQLIEDIGMFNSEFDGSQDHDLILRVIEQTENIVHIPKILYHWRIHSASTAGGITGVKDYAVASSIKAIENHLERIGLQGTVSQGKHSGVYCIDYKLEHIPKVSIIIPNKDHKEDLEKCLESIKKSTYPNYEILIIENNSQTTEIREYYKEVTQADNVKLLEWKKGFNYSAINNFGAEHAEGDYFILLNNDIEIITPDWIEQMLMYCQREDVGIVGAKLYYPDDTIQHAGVIVGIGQVAGHSHKHFAKEDMGYFVRLNVVQNLSAVTAACLMVKKDVFWAVGGLDDGYAVAFNDVDFCLQVREIGKLVVFNPQVEAYHYESKSRGHEDSPEKIARFKSEIERFENKWGLYRRDPYYNDNLTLEKEDFTRKIN